MKAHMHKAYGNVHKYINDSDAGTGGARGATGPPNMWQIS